MTEAVRTEAGKPSATWSVWNDPAARLRNVDWLAGLIAALLPCFWVYWDVAQAITSDAAPDNPYRAWIDTYADPHFGEAVARVIGTADVAAAATTQRIRSDMLAAFRRSTQYEWLFWDGAYHRRGWPAFG